MSGFSGSGGVPTTPRSHVVQAPCEGVRICSRIKIYEKKKEFLIGMKPQRLGKRLDPERTW